MAAFDTATKVFDDAADAAEYVKAGILNNNEINGARFNDWQNAGTAFDLYIDGNNAGLAKSVKRDQVVAIVRPWLEERQAFELALTSATDFLVYIDTWDLDREDLCKIRSNRPKPAAPAWVSKIGNDYIGLLDDGAVVTKDGRGSYRVIIPH